MNWLGFARLINTIYRGNPPSLELIRKLGLLAIKIGQTYALRVDFLSEKSCQHLSQLYRHVEGNAPVDATPLIQAVTDPAWRQHFSRIDPLPLASASVGQVHRAVMHDGKPVAVKIVKQDFRETFTRDVRSLRRLVRAVQVVYPVLQRVADPEGILETIEHDTLRELDLRQEIEGQKLLRSIHDRFKGQFDLSSAAYPTIHEALSNQRVMVSDLIEGETLDELLAAGRFAYDQLLELFRIHGFHLFCVGTFHADVHPGNIMYREGTFWFLDTGAVASVGKKMRTGLFSFFDALSCYDYPRCARALNAMAEREIRGEAYDRFERKFIELYRDFTNATVSQVSLTRRMMETIRLGVLSGMEFERGMYPIIKSLMYLDGMVLRCNPQAMLVRDMRRFIDDFKAHI